MQEAAPRCLCSTASGGAVSRPRVTYAIFVLSAVRAVLLPPYKDVLALSVGKPITLPPQRDGCSVVLFGFVVAVCFRFELEGGVLQVEVASQALAEPIQELAAALGQGWVGDDDVR